MSRLRNLSVSSNADRYAPSLVAYGCVAVVSALAEWLSFYIMLSLIGPASASVVDLLIATAVNFLLSHHVAFRSMRSYRREFLLVFGMSSIAFVANFTLFYALYTLAAVNIMIAKIVGTCFGFIFNFTIRQFFIFSRAPRFRSATAILAGKNDSSELASDASGRHSPSKRKR